MTALATALAQALADATALRNEYNNSIDEWQDFFTAVAGTVDITKPDATQVTVDNLAQMKADFQALVDNGQDDYSPVIDVGVAVTNFPGLLETYYVDPATGDDGDDGLTAGTAFATIDKAMSVARQTHLVNILLEPGQTYTPTSVWATRNQLIIGVNGAADRDNTVIDFSNVQIVDDIAGCITAYGGGVISVGDVTIKCGEQYESGGGFTYNMPAIRAIFGGVAELTNVRILAGDNTDEYTGSPIDYAQSAIEIHNGSCMIQGSCRIDMAAAGVTGGKVNGVVMRQDGYVMVTSSDFYNCAIALTDQFVGRPGGFFVSGGGVTFDASVDTTLDISSVYNQVAVQNFS